MTETEGESPSIRDMLGEFYLTVEIMPRAGLLVLDHTLVHEPCLQGRLLVAASNLDGERASMAALVALATEHTCPGPLKP